MKTRLEVLLSLVKNCNVLADVGCDHGLLAKSALTNGVCKKVIISDISSKSLEKAIALLKPFNDKVSSFVCDGFTLYEGMADSAVIAGMGGEEICQILKGVKILPKNLVLSPQKNSNKVRRLLIELGYKITSDFTFSDGKFYDAIQAEKGEDSYTEKEFIFGRDNLKNRPNDFIEKLKSQEVLLKNILKNPNIIDDNDEISKKLKLIQEVLYEN